jgi:hypothetical protein
MTSIRENKTVELTVLGIKINAKITTNTLQILLKTKDNKELSF